MKFKEFKSDNLFLDLYKCIYFLRSWNMKTDHSIADSIKSSINYGTLS